MSRQDEKGQFLQMTIMLWIVTIVFLQIHVTKVTIHVSTITTCLLGTYFACRLCLKIQLIKFHMATEYSFLLAAVIFHLLCIAYD